MKPQIFKPAISGFIAGSLCLSITACGQANSQTTQKAETKETREKKARNFDDVLEDLDRTSIKLEQDLKRPLPPIQPIDAAKIRAEVEQALKEVDVAKLRTEIELSLSKVDFDKMKAEIAKIKDIDFAKIEAEMKDIQPQMERSLKSAKESIEKAKVEVKEYKAFEEGLKKDGLIDKENYTVEHKDETLKINGKVQPAEVYNKYRSFLEKHKSFTLRKNENNFDIHN
ncbi:MAG: hypothetical protein JWP88_2134 [Flaviaesturariibacter sp.]|nr:hypothetical protein [Flaviaesturariibacter sp.]